MPRPNPDNILRPDRIIKERKPVMPKQPVKKLLKEMPAHYLESQRANKKIKTCCQDINNLEYSTYKTDDTAANADLGVFTCTKCGSNHYRVAQGPGKVTG